MANIKLDASDFLKKSKGFVLAIEGATKNAVEAVANEVLRLSQFQVPHDTGQLQNTGHVEPGDNQYQKIVGYNKVYAARLHEHPEYRFQGGRKGKYLEDPIKNNLSVFHKFISDNIKGVTS